MLHDHENDVINQKEYASLIGSLRYVTDCTRPDIAYAVGVLSRFTSNPGFSDADWNTLSGDSCSTTSYIFTLAGGAICWKSKKQTIIAKSTMEAELIALASASEEANCFIVLSRTIVRMDKAQIANFRIRQARGK
ncbi:secreted RxLR effector protein 161-like [Lycium ferocissimum]|uniref:secreted RxLR effector protein 161-like n=1 Tax=Lycium ferocissimum TaxID=112874 RepID=UPI002814E50A|nr:secreted RxLR effector protein 161-like [Lycium ferocissimum]